MYITLETDYAVRIVSELCKTGSKLDAKTISTNTLVPLRFAVKILRKLVSLDIVRSYQGVQGGYQINKAPKEISLKTIVEAIEGTYYFSRCLSDEHACNRGMEDQCCFHKAFGEITEVIRRELESRNFADMTRCVRNARELEKNG